MKSYLTSAEAQAKGLPSVDEQIERYNQAVRAERVSHLVALQARLAHEKARYAADRSEIRHVWIAQIEREIAQEEKILGIESATALPQMTDDELLAELAS